MSKYPECSACEDEADYTVTTYSHDPEERRNPFRFAWLCAACLPPALIVTLIKLGVVVQDVHTLKIISP